MADSPGPELEEEVEYIEVYEEVTDEDDEAGELVEQLHAAGAPAEAAAATGESSPSAAPVPSHIPAPEEATSAAAAGGQGSPGSAHSGSTSTAGVGTFQDVELPASPLQSMPAEPAAAAASGAAAGIAAAAAAAASAVELGSQGDLVLMEQHASKVATEMAQLASQVTHKLHDGFLQAFSSAAAITATGGNGSSSSSSSSQGRASSAAAIPQQQQQQQRLSETPSGAAAAAAAAAAGIRSKLTGGLSGLSSWWSNLDQSLAANNTPVAQPGSSPAEKLQKSVSPEAQLATLFGLSSGEALVESYSCSLMQSYACGHNSLTPPMQITFEGKLYITDKHACFHAAAEQQEPPAAAAAADNSSSSSPASKDAADGGGSSSSGPANKPKAKRQARKMPQLTFRIAHADVAAATREPNPARSAGSRVLASDLLQIVVEPKGVVGSSSSSSSGLVRAGVVAAAADVAAVAGPREGLGPSGRWTVVFQSFEPSSGLDGALALIEHLREG